MEMGVLEMGRWIECAGGGQVDREIGVLEMGR